jgi:hypothetical protein
MDDEDDDDDDDKAQRYLLKQVPKDMGKAIDFSFSGF